MKIAFWGEGEASGTTSNMLAAASALANAYPYKSVMLQTGKEDRSISQNFSDTEGENFDLKEGCAYYALKGLDYLISVGRKCALTKKQVQDNMHPLIGEKLFCLSSGGRVLCDYYPKETNRVLKQVIGLADQNMDFTFIDCGCRSDPWTMQLLREADLVVVNIKQSQQAFDHFFLQHSNISEKVIFFISRYQKDSIYNRKNIHRLYRIDPKRLAVIPYNPEFPHACEKGKLDKYMKGKSSLYPSQVRQYFMQELSQAVQILLENVNDAGEK